jgi:hypothetical protein
MLNRSVGDPMAYRIDISSDAKTLRFQGLLDRAALGAIERSVLAAAGELRLVLLGGSEIEPGCLGALLGLPRLRISAEAPYLARLLSEERR